MENEKKRLAQEFVDEVMSGKYPNIEIDENGYIDHYGIKYRLKILGDGEKILVFSKYTIGLWINAILTGIAAVLFVEFLMGGLFAVSMDGASRRFLASVCFLWAINFVPYFMMLTVKRNQFQRYIDGKFSRSKNQK